MRDPSLLIVSLLFSQKNSKTPGFRKIARIEGKGKKSETGPWKRHSAWPWPGGNVVPHLTGSEAVLHHVGRSRGSGTKVTILQPLCSGNYICALARNTNSRAMSPFIHPSLRSLCPAPQPQCKQSASPVHTFQRGTPAVHVGYPASKIKCRCLTALFLSVDPSPSILWSRVLFPPCSTLMPNKGNNTQGKHGAREILCNLQMLIVIRQMPHSKGFSDKPPHFLQPQCPIL